MGCSGSAQSLLEEKKKQNKTWVIGVSPGAGDPTAVTPARRTLPRPSQRHRKLLVLSCPSCAGFFGTGCALSRRVRGPQQHPACPVPWPSWAPKDFAPGSEDVTTATTGRAQRRCQVWRGSIRSSPGKPPEDIHPYPGHPSHPGTSIPMWNIHPVPGHPSQPGTSISSQDIHPNQGHPSQSGTSIPTQDIPPNPGHPSQPDTSGSTSGTSNGQSRLSAQHLCFWVPPSPSPAGNQGHKPPREFRGTGTFNQPLSRWILPRAGTTCV